METQTKLKVSELKFMKPVKCNNENKEIDCIVTITKAFSKERGIKTPSAVSFVFKNKCHEYLAPTGRLEVLFIGNRIYFRDSKAGYKLSIKSNENNRYLKIDFIHHGYDLSEVKDYAGEYKLLYDTREKLYYLDTSKKLN